MILTSVLWLELERLLVELPESEDLWAPVLGAHLAASDEDRRREKVRTLRLGSVDREMLRARKRKYRRESEAAEWSASAVRRGNPALAPGAPEGYLRIARGPVLTSAATAEEWETWARVCAWCADSARELEAAVNRGRGVRTLRDLEVVLRTGRRA